LRFWKKKKGNKESKMKDGDVQQHAAIDVSISGDKKRRGKWRQWHQIDHDLSALFAEKGPEKGAVGAVLSEMKRLKEEASSWAWQK
jgi:hypothetical protein